jgi:hypothetical protein
MKEREDSLRRDLNRKIWLELRKYVDWGDIEENIRVARAAACKAVTEVTRRHKATSDYKQLTLAELRAVLHYIRTGQLPSKIASARQLGMLKALEIRCATWYETDGQSTDIRPRSQQEIYNLFDRYINPLVMKWLEEGGFRPRRYVDYSSLRSDECSYLIQRFRAMLNNLIIRHEGEHQLN